MLCLLSALHFSGLLRMMARPASEKHASRVPIVCFFRDFGLTLSKMQLALSELTTAYRIYFAATASTNCSCAKILNLY